jgi:uncharacterized protein (DUF58 family)
LAGTAEKYLKPEVIRQVSRLDLRAKFIVEGFLSGLHASPFHGFSVEFSEHRKYTPGDNIADIDWNVYAKTDRFYIKKFQAETNLTGYLVMDLSGSMDFTHRRQRALDALAAPVASGGRGWLGRIFGRKADAAAERAAADRPDLLTKFEYAVSLAAALGYLMIHQQDPVGMMAFDTKVRHSLAPKSRRSQLGDILSLLARLKPQAETDIVGSLHQVAGMLKHRSLVILFSDLLSHEDDPKPIHHALHRLRHSGHDVILFHVLDESEVLFPFEGMVEMKDPETGETLTVDADGIKADYLEGVASFQALHKKECLGAGIDYVPLHTGMPFDKALMSYLVSRQARA